MAGIAGAGSIVVKANGRRKPRAASTKTTTSNPATARASSMLS